MVFFYESGYYIDFVNIYYNNNKSIKKIIDNSGNSVLLITLM